MIESNHTTKHHKPVWINHITETLKFLSLTKLKLFCLPFGPYLSWASVNSSRLKPLISLTEKWSNTSDAGYVWASSMSLSATIKFLKFDFFGVSVKSKATNDTFYIWDSISTHSRVNKAKPLFNQTVEMRNFTAAFFHMYVHAAWTRLTLIGWNSVTCYTATKIQLSVHFRFFADFRCRLPEHTKLIAFPESKLDPTVFLNQLFYGRSRSILICKTTASNNLISKEA